MKCRWCDYEFKRGGPRKAFLALDDHVERVHPEHYRDAAFNAAVAEDGEFETPCICGHVESMHRSGVGIIIEASCWGDDCKCKRYRQRRPDCGDIRCD